jgi:hypothetical protein
MPALPQARISRYREGAGASGKRGLDEVNKVSAAGATASKDGGGVLAPARAPIQLVADGQVTGQHHDSPAMAGLLVWLRA